MIEVKLTLFWQQIYRDSFVGMKPETNVLHL
jgi:hypothetical protein